MIGDNHVLYWSNLWPDRRRNYPDSTTAPQKDANADLYNSRQWPQRFEFCFDRTMGASVFLCLVAVAQGCVALRHEIRKTTVSRMENRLFFLLYLGFGFLGMVTAQDFVWAIHLRNLLELLPIIGALMLMLSVFAKTEQKTRLFLLFNGASWLVYTIIVGSTAFFTALIAIISSSIALIKYRSKA